LQVLINTTQFLNELETASHYPYLEAEKTMEMDHPGSCGAGWYFPRDDSQLYEHGRLRDAKNGARKVKRAQELGKMWLKRKEQGEESKIKEDGTGNSKCDSKEWKHEKENKTELRNDGRMAKRVQNMERRG